MKIVIILSFLLLIGCSTLVHRIPMESKSYRLLQVNDDYNNIFRLFDRYGIWTSYSDKELKYIVQRDSTLLKYSDLPQICSLDSNYIVIIHGPLTIESNLRFFLVWPKFSQVEIRKTQNLDLVWTDSFYGHVSSAYTTQDSLYLLFKAGDAIGLSFK